MAVFTVEELNTQITAYKAALLALATAQSYEFTSGGSTRRLTRANLPEIRDTLQYLDNQLQKVATGTDAPAGRTYAKNAGGRW